MNHPTPIRVLFVCIENSCRSQMAEGFARVLGEGKIAAYSAGSAPSGIVNPTAVAVMKEKGIDISTHSSKSVAELPVQSFDVIVTMGCGDVCPAMSASQRIEWNIPDPKSLPIETFRAVRDEIEDHVKDLLNTLL
jgi:glutathione/glutaredoxin type arsenate reductase